MPKQSDIFFAGGAGAISQPVVTEYASYPAVVGTDFIATSVNPVFGTTDKNTITIHRNGKYAEIVWSYSHTAAGTAGTGNYRFVLPSGLNVDTDIMMDDTFAAGKLTINDAANEDVYDVGLGVGSTNTLYIRNIDGASTWAATSACNFGDTALNFLMTVRVPIAEWSESELVSTLPEQTTIEATSITTTLMTALDTYTDITGATLALTEGTWMIGYGCSFYAGALGSHNAAIRTASNAIVPRTLSYINAQANDVHHLSMQTFVTVGAGGETYKLSGRSGVSTSSRIYGTDASITGNLTNPDGTCNLWAVRLLK